MKPRSIGHSPTVNADSARWGLEMEPSLRRLLAGAADGDVRRALNLLEIAADLVDDGTHALTRDVLLRVLEGGSARRFDQGGDAFYDQISALHKSIRGSNPDGALYWVARMLDGGCDPRYLARRLVRIASEDIGNADPRALTLGLDAWEVQERLGRSGGRARAGARGRVHGVCAKEQRALHRIRRSDARCARARLSGGSETPPKRSHAAARDARGTAKAIGMRTTSPMATRPGNDTCLTRCNKGATTSRPGGGSKGESPRSFGSCGHSMRRPDRNLAAGSGVDPLQWTVCGLGFMQRRGRTSRSRRSGGRRWRSRGCSDRGLIARAACRAVPTVRRSTDSPGARMGLSRSRLRACANGVAVRSSRCASRSRNRARSSAAEASAGSRCGRWFPGSRMPPCELRPSPTECSNSLRIMRSQEVR